MVKDEKLESAKNEIENEDPDHISGVESDEYVQYIVSKYNIEPIEIYLDAAQIDAEDFSRDENPELVIPVNENTDLLDYKPSRYSVSSAYKGTVQDNELRVEIVVSGRRGWAKDKLNKDLNQAKSYIEKHIGYLKDDIEDYHQKLEQTAEKYIETCREEIREQREMLGSLDVPLRDQN